MEKIVDIVKNTFIYLKSAIDILWKIHRNNHSDSVNWMVIEMSEKVTEWHNFAFKSPLSHLLVDLMAEFDSRKPISV